MAKNCFFKDFAEFMARSSQFHGEIICDALGFYFMHPENWSCPEDGIAAFQMLTLCDSLGLNTFLEKFDAVNNPVVSNLAFQLGLADWFSDQHRVGKEVQHND